LKITIRKDFETCGNFHVLPELDIQFDTEIKKINYVRLAFLTHELWLEFY